MAASGARLGRIAFSLMPDLTSQSEIVNAKTRDYFEELYVAGILGDAGWSIYFPKRDVGFDFIAVKELRGHVVIRPVQVKGKYPAGSTRNRAVYGYVGQLSLFYPEMMLAVSYFPTDQRGVAPTCVAYRGCLKSLMLVRADLSMRRVAAMSSRVSEVCTRYS